MLGIYFSGTGNTKHCVEEFVKSLGADNTVLALENPNIAETIRKHDDIALGYPIYFSNAPKIVRDFIEANGACFNGKKLFIIATMGLFSGDGAGCAARLLKKHGARVIGGLHIKMPDCIGDVKLLKKPLSENRELVRQADEKIKRAAESMKRGNPTQDGLNIVYHMAGLFGQRLWFYGESSSYKEKPDVNAAKCVGCGRCAGVCPMKNISIVEGKAVSGNKCTLCYRCFSLCPQKALTILGKEVFEQCRFENYR